MFVLNKFGISLKKMEQTKKRKKKNTKKGRE